MRELVMVGAVVAVGLGMWGCGGSYSIGNSGNPNSPIPAAGGYHCSIHPVMVGSINQGTSSQTPCQGAYCE
jgi:hypothetical protein